MKDDAKRRFTLSVARITTLAPCSMTDDRADVLVDELDEALDAGLRAGVESLKEKFKADGLEFEVVV